MLWRIIKLFKGDTPTPTLTPVAKRLIPDPERVVAGFSPWMIWRREGVNNADAPYIEQKAFFADLEKRGMKRNEAGIPLDSPFVDKILKQLIKWKSEPNYQGSATLTFKLRSDVKPDWEWFEIRPNPCSHPPLNERKFECNAARMPNHRPWIYGNFISEQCKESIEAAGLTGLEYTWVSDVGRYQARQWFHAIATEPFWSDLNDPALLHKINVEACAAIGIPIADALLKIFPKQLTFKIFPQASRESIPSTDFAFSAYSVNGHTVFTMWCSARARNFLRGEGILVESEFVPIWIWDSPPEGAELSGLPDKGKLLPYPLIEPEWKWVQEQLPARQAAFLNNPKPVFNLTASSVLKKFQTLRKQNPPLHPTPGRQAVSSTTNQQNLKLPTLWERVLGISENFTVYTDKNEVDESAYIASGFDVITRNELANPEPYLQPWLEEKANRLGVRASDYVLFGSRDGDYLSFDLKGLTDDGDCRVVEWCHDPLSISREWPSIIQLLAESMELEEAGS